MTCKVLCICAGMVLFGASSVLAGGINLAWNNCASEGGSANRSNACDSNAGTNVLTGSFVLDSDLAAVLGIEIVLDFIAGDGTSDIPPWWDMGDAGCRAGSLTANPSVNAANTVCTDWGNSAATSTFLWFGQVCGPAIPIANCPAHRRIVLWFAVPVADVVNLVAGQEYFGFNLRLDNAKTVGTPTCAGCTAPVCIVLNSLNVGTTSIEVHQLLSTGTIAGSNMATWQGTGPSCLAVPVKNRTWGQVKALYR